MPEYTKPFFLDYGNGFLNSIGMYTINNGLYKIYWNYLTIEDEKEHKTKQKYGTNYLLH